MRSNSNHQSGSDNTKIARWNPFQAPLPAEGRLYDRLHGDWLVKASIVIVFIIGFVARVAYRNLESGDYQEFLSPWYDVIKEGGFAALGQQVGDYNIMYQSAIYVLTMVPLPKLFAYKALSCFFDVVLAAACGLISYTLAIHLHKDERLWGVLGFSLVFLSPTVVLNSSAWAQCDSIYSAFCILSLMALMRRKNLAAFVLLGFAFCFKLQAVLLFPLYVYAAIADKRFSLLAFMTIPLVMVAITLPFIPLGRSALDTFYVYANQMSTYPRMALNFPSLWMACVPGAIHDSVEMYARGGSLFAVAVTAGAIFLEAVALMRRRVPVNVDTILPLALLFSLTCVVLLPAMHERYAYLVDVLAILVALMNSRLLVSAFALNVASLMTTVRFLFSLRFLPDYRWFSVAYVLVALYTVATLFSMVCNNSSTEDNAMQEVGQ